PVQVGTATLFLPRISAGRQWKCQDVDCAGTGDPRISCPIPSLSTVPSHATGTGRGDIPPARIQQQRDGQAHGGQPAHGQSFPAYGNGQDGSFHSRRNRGQGHRIDVVPLRRFGPARIRRSEEHTSELQSRGHLVCRL